MFDLAGSLASALAFACPMPEPPWPHNNRRGTFVGWATQTAGHRRSACGAVLSDTWSGGYEPKGWSVTKNLSKNRWTGNRSSAGNPALCAEVQRGLCAWNCYLLDLLERTPVRCRVFSSEHHLPKPKLFGDVQLLKPRTTENFRFPMDPKGQSEGRNLGSHCGTLICR